jgi:hypothetical protein
MNRHRLTYVDLHPEALGREKAPHPLALIAGAIVAALAFYLATVFLFSL